MHLLEAQQPFSKSMIWQLQRKYFEEAGIEAWRSGAVPHYVTSNPVVGKTYAELVLALLRDLALKGQNQETVYLLEAGAGHGRLCYHFFKHFEKYYHKSPIPLPPICYILSDFTQTNLNFWKNHPRLQPYLKKGWLDLALFDVEHDTEIHLQYRKQTLQRQSLSQPLMVVANYFFDTIPQELFFFEGGKYSQCLLSLHTEVDPAGLSTAELLAALKLQYDYQEIDQAAYKDEPKLNKILEGYQHRLANSHILFPHLGIRFIERLRQLSNQGLVLLTADKGDHFLANMDNLHAPVFVTHGSFSVSVNYHAFRKYCENEDGMALFPRYEPFHLNLGCMLFLPEADTYLETINAYNRFVDDYGPDDFFSMKKFVEQHIDIMTFEDIMGTLRLSGYDAQVFSQMQNRLMALLPEISDNKRWLFLKSVVRIWDTYYPIGEDIDLAFQLGNLLLTADFYQEAITYFELSISIYGKKAASLHNMIMCYCLLEDFANAQPIINDLKTLYPDDEKMQKAVKLFESKIVEAG